jgi:hypothetical protein
VCLSPFTKEQFSGSAVCKLFSSSSIFYVEKQGSTACTMAVLLSLSEDALVSVLCLVDGKSLGYLSQTCTVLRDVLSRRAEPWRAALLQTPPSTAQHVKPFLPVWSTALRARSAFVLLYCRAAPKPRCPGCGAAAGSNVGAIADTSTLPICAFVTRVQRRKLVVPQHVCM